MIYRLVRVGDCEAVNGHWCFQSNAFDNASQRTDDEHPDDMSVVLGDTLAALGREPGKLPDETSWINVAEDWGVAALEARYLTQEEEQVILRTPNAEPAHGDVRGKKGSSRRKRIKKHAWWICQPAKRPE